MFKKAEIAGTECMRACVCMCVCAFAFFAWVRPYVHVCESVKVWSLPRLSTIWTRSNVSSQKLLSAVGNKQIQYSSTRCLNVIFSWSHHTFKMCPFKECSYVTLIFLFCYCLFINYNVILNIWDTLKTGMLVFISIRKSVNLVRPSPWVTGSFTLISR